MDVKNYMAEGEYPEAVIEEKNPLEAKKLMNDYSGREGETTAIMTYAYQAYMLAKDYPDISGALEGIAVVEMKHHELLGETIAGLGGYPVIGGRNYFWNGSFADYVTDPEKMLRNDIAGEKRAIINYEKTILIIKNDSIKALLRRIIKDEESHIEVLEKLLADYAAGKK